MLRLTDYVTVMTSSFVFWSISIFDPQLSCTHVLLSQEGPCFTSRSLHTLCTLSCQHECMSSMVTSSEIYVIAACVAVGKTTNDSICQPRVLDTSRLAPGLCSVDWNMGRHLSSGGNDLECGKEEKESCELSFGPADVEPWRWSLSFKHDRINFAHCQSSVRIGAWVGLMN